MDKDQIAVVLALVGGLISLSTAIMMLLRVCVFAAAAPFEAMVFMGLFLGWMVIGGALGGALMLMAAPKLRRPLDMKRGTTLAFVGGGIAILGVNILGGALGIVAGAMLMSETPTAPPPV